MELSFFYFGHLIIQLTLRQWAFSLLCPRKKQTILRRFRPISANEEAFNPSPDY